MQNIDVLIERCQAGDEHATESLYNYHQAQVFRLAYGILGNREDAEEITQDALVYALTKINRYDSQKARFSTWLHTITVSRCRNKLRGKKSLWLSLSAWLEERGGDVPDKKPAQEAGVIQNELRDEVWASIRALTPSLREAIILRHWGELTYREIAEVLGCPIRTAAELNALEPIKDRTRLIIGDVLEANLRFKNSWPYWEADWRGDSILMSFDPIAHDTVGLQILEQLQALNKPPRARTPIPAGVGLMCKFDG